MPKRIQRKRTKGWRMPEGAVYVGRPTKWGNPFKVGKRYGVREGEDGRVVTTRMVEDAQDAVDCFENFMNQDLSFDLREDARRELRGRDLVCWCPLDQSCHADVLLKIANEGSA